MKVKVLGPKNIRLLKPRNECCRFPLVCTGDPQSRKLSYANKTAPVIYHDVCRGSHVLDVLFKARILMAPKNMHKPY